MASAIKAGRVALNGTIVDGYTQPMDTACDNLTLDGNAVSAPMQGEYLYIMLNKPVGVLCATQDARGRRTVMDLLPPHLRRFSLHLVGRLDMDSCGLIIITNDGDLTYSVTHPRFEKEKEYAVTLNTPITPAHKAKIEQGLLLSDGPTSTAVVRIDPKQPSICYVTLHEGRKRQIRRMFATMGYRVVELRRTREGLLLLDGLPEGQSRLLTEQEVAGLRAV